MDPDRYLADAEAFDRAINREHYLEGAGLQAGLNLTPIYTKYLSLFEGERFDEARSWGLEPTEERYLRDFIAGGHMGQQTKAISEKLAATEAAATVVWDEVPIPYRQLPGMIANEADAPRRHAMEQCYLDVMATMNPLRDDRQKRAHLAAVALGYPDYVALFDDVRALHLADLTEKMQAFIGETNDLYFAALDTYLSEMRILRDDARKCDLARIFRASALDALFPEERMLATLHATTRDFGVVLEDQKHIHLDTEARPLKSPRAFCATIQVPDDIRLVIKPSGGVQDYEALLHEAGHAEHYAHVDRTLSFPYRCLGDAAVTESYAFLLEYLMHEPSWLYRHLGITRPESFFQLAGFHKLYFLRRYGTKLVYEQELHRADEPGDLAEYYDELFTTNLGVGYGPESSLADVDAGFYAAQYLRAWIFEAQHRQYLQQEFDDEWFRNPRAGKFLIELWRDGQRNPVEKLAEFMGYAGLDIGPVTDEIRALMGAK